MLVSLGRDADAAQRFQEVVDKSGSGLYGRMARLGLADVQVRQGKFDPAIATYKELTATAKDDLPVDGVLMALGRAYAAAGKKTEAGQTFKRIGDEFPSSPYAADAKRELDALTGPAPDRSPRPTRTSRCGSSAGSAFPVPLESLHCLPVTRRGMMRATAPPATRRNSAVHAPFA